jgi:hypothetical protein
MLFFIFSVNICFSCFPLEKDVSQVSREKLFLHASLIKNIIIFKTFSPHLKFLLLLEATITVFKSGSLLQNNEVLKQSVVFGVI